MKKIVFLIITILLILIIYKCSYHNNKSILIIGDSIANGLSNKKITYNFTDELIKNHPSQNFQIIFQKDYRIRDLNTAIQNNIKYQNQNYQKLIKNSSYIILFIGLEEIYNQLNSQIKPSEIMNNISTEYEELITTIKSYNQNIAIINYFTIKEIDLSPLNEFLTNLSIENNIDIIAINDIVSNQKYLTYNNHLLLSEKVNEFLINKCQFDKNVKK